MVAARMIDPPEVQNRLYRGEGRQPTGYRLGDAGAKRLKDMGYDVATGSGHWRDKNHTLGDIFYRHDLLTTQINFGILRAADERGFDYNWRTDSPEIHDQVDLFVAGRKQTLPIRPDSYGVLRFRGEDGKLYSRHLFIEADRATEPGYSQGLDRSSLRRKYEAYQRWAFQEKGHVKKFGIRGFLVLTVTSSPDRAENLRQVAQKIDDRGGSHLFWSTAFPGRKDCEPWLEPIWVSAGDPADSKRKHSLIEVAT